jgi:ribosomal protein L15
MPKLRGFSNFEFTTHYNVVNLSDLEIISKAGNTEINKELLLEKGVIRNKKA